MRCYPQNVPSGCSHSHSRYLHAFIIFGAASENIFMTSLISWFLTQEVHHSLFADTAWLVIHLTTNFWVHKLSAFDAEECAPVHQQAITYCRHLQSIDSVYTQVFSSTSTWCFHPSYSSRLLTVELLGDTANDELLHKNAIWSLLALIRWHRAIVNKCYDWRLAIQNE